MSRSVPSHRWQTLGVLLVAAVVGCDGGTTGPTIGLPAKLAFTVQPTDATAGASIAPAGPAASGRASGNVITAAVAIQDASGNVVTTATNAVTIAIGTNPAGGTLSGTATVSAVNGVANFTDFTIDKAGTGYTLGASATDLSSAASSAFAITPAASAQIAIALGDGQRGPTGQALPNPFVVEVSDEFGNATPGVTVDWAVTAGGGTVSNLSSVTDATGQASTTLTTGRLGANSVTATVMGLTPATFTGIGQAVITDPAGDEFSTAASAGLVPPDIVKMTAWPEAGNLWIEIEFVDNVVSEVTGGPNVVVGFLDIDSDQDPATGTVPATDVFRPGAGSTGMGSDYVVALSTSFEVFVFDVSVGAFVLTGSFTPTFSGNTLSMAIQLSLLGGDDGFVNLSTVLGTVPEPTDIAPNDQSLMLNLALGTVARGSGTAELTSPPRRWGSWKKRE